MSIIEGGLATKGSSSFPGLAGYRGTQSCGTCRACKGRKRQQAPVTRTQRMGGVAHLRSHSGQTWTATFGVAPDEASASLARFTAALAATHMKHLFPEIGKPERCVEVPSGREVRLPRRVPIQWSWPDGVRHGFASMDRRYIALCKSLRGADLVETVLHEVRHLAHPRIKLGDGTLSGLHAAAEIDAERYATAMGPAVLIAYRETKGQVSRVSFSKHPPHHRARHLDVCIAGGKVFQYFNYSHWVRCWER